jgi:hypothetical protein
MPKKKQTQRSQAQPKRASGSLAVLPVLATDKLRLKMPWLKMWLDGSAAPGFVTTTLVLNDIYNIDSAGVATSRPQMYDQLALIYQNFKVFSVKIHQAWSISDGYRHLVAIAPRRASSAPANIAQACLRRGSAWGFCSMYEHKEIVRTYNLSDLAGPAYVDHDFTGQYATSPVKTVALDICSAPVNTGVATSLQCITYVEFDVEWSQRRNTANA